MHDTFLNERIYEALLKLCVDNGILRLNKVRITVHTDSHITEKSLQEYFTEHSHEQVCSFVGNWTDILLERQEIGQLNAIITSIEGVTSDG